MTKKIKLSDLAKDLNVPSQELIEALTKLDETKKKTGSSLTDQEVNYLLERYSQGNQVESFDAYYESRNDKPAEKPAPKLEEKPKRAAKSEPKKAAKPAPKPEAKPAAKQESKPAPKSEAKPAVKQENKPAPKSEAKPAAKQESKPAQKAKSVPDEARYAAAKEKTMSEAKPQKQQKPQKLQKSQPQQGQKIGSMSSESVIEKKQRTVDTRGSYVELDKYNERYEQIAPQNKHKENYSTKKQKINQKSQQRQKQQYSNKRETEAEKLRRLELERARKQQLKVMIPDSIMVSELATRLKVTVTDVIKKLMGLGVMATINQEIDFDTAALVAEELGAKVEKEVIVTIEERLIVDDEDDEGDLQERSPVVVVMGHVDHGKTSILDRIRHANVTASEAGGITQHIGAYQVNHGGKTITFLDTPGHEAFTSMRMRGAQSTDIAILVVAADDGVMPQTVEAINHAKAAGVEIIVAINKIDKEGANVERVKQELAEYELIPEDWGGSTVFVPVSAHTKEGIEQLLEMIVLTSEVLELKANPNRKARGIVIEARLDKGRGPVATVLVQKGTLHIGDHVAVGPAHGKVRAMIDHKGERVKVATPSTPVEILGLNGAPDAGEIFVATESDKEAKQISQAYIDQSKDKLLEETKSKKLSLDGLFNQIQAGNVKDLNLIIKADVQGSVEAVKQSLLKLGNEEVAVRVIHGGVGAITESDVSLASASNAIIIGFNIRPDNTAKEVAECENVDVRLYRVIYDAIEDIENALKGMLEPIYEEKVIGHVEVRQTFKASGVGTIAGSYVLDGKVQRGCRCRVYRGDDMIFEGDLASLKRFKDDVKEVAAGYECGLVFSNFNDIQMEDRVECYIMVEVPR